MRQNTFCTVPEWLKDLLNDPFRRILFLALILLGIGIVIVESSKPVGESIPNQHQISFFFHPQCPHCRAQKAFIPYLKAKYPELKWKYYDTSLAENSRLLQLYIPPQQPTFPPSRRAHDLYRFNGDQRL